MRSRQRSRAAWFWSLSILPGVTRSAMLYESRQTFAITSLITVPLTSFQLRASSPILSYLDKRMEPKLHLDRAFISGYPVPPMTEPDLEALNSKAAQSHVEAHRWLAAYHRKEALQVSKLKPQYKAHKDLQHRINLLYTAHTKLAAMHRGQVTHATSEQQQPVPPATHGLEDPKGVSLMACRLFMSVGARRRGRRKDERDRHSENTSAGHRPPEASSEARDTANNFRTPLEMRRELRRHFERNWHRSESRARDLRHLVNQARSQVGTTNERDLAHLEKGIEGWGYLADVNRRWSDAYLVSGFRNHQNLRGYSASRGAQARVQHRIEATRAQGAGSDSNSDTRTESSGSTGELRSSSRRESHEAPLDRPRPGRGEHSNDSVTGVFSRGRKEGEPIGLLASSARQEHLVEGSSSLTSLDHPSLSGAAPKNPHHFDLNLVPPDA